MSSDQRPSTSSEADSSEDQMESGNNKEKKVCFICGSHTIFIVNIHEPRSGPNMIDVISAKFKMRPLNDDKFLCYSCNNWLINWYTVQRCAEHQCDSDASTATTTLARSSGNNTAGGDNESKNSNKIDHQYYVHHTTVQCHKKRRKICTNNDIISISKENVNLTKQSDKCFTRDTVKTLQNNKRKNNANCLTFDNSSSSSSSRSRGNDDFIFTTAVQSVRSTLHKYLYYPNKRRHVKNHLSSSFPSSTLPLPLSRPTIPLTVKHKTESNNENNYKINNFHLKCRKHNTFCHRCLRSSKFYRQQILNNCRANYDRQTYDSESIVTSSDSIYDNKCVEHILKESNIVKKLQSLGTTIYCEQINKMQFYDDNLVDSSTDLSNRNAIDIKSSNNMPFTMTKQLNETNEILLTFNTVVTEVFPIDCIKVNVENHSNENCTENVCEIIKNVPKSLTITLT